MRGLSVKQKKLLEKSVREYINQYRGYPTAVDELDNLSAIEDVNPNEIFWSAANKYVYDLSFDIPLN